MSFASIAMDNNNDVANSFWEIKCTFLFIIYSVLNGSCIPFLKKVQGTNKPITLLLTKLFF